MSIEDDAEEITQDVFVKAYRNLSKFDFRSSFSTWLFRIAYNEAITHTRRRRIDGIPFDEATLNNLSDSRVDSFLESDNPRLAALPEAIESLNVDERALISFATGKTSASHVNANMVKSLESSWSSEGSMLALLVPITALLLALDYFFRKRIAMHYNHRQA